MKHQQYKGIQYESMSPRLEQLKRNGYYIAEGVLSQEQCRELAEELDNAWSRQRSKFGDELLKSIGDWGQIRGLMIEHPAFMKLITHSKLSEFVNEVLGDTAILHLQNGIVLHPSVEHNQAKYHKDFAKDFISSEVLSFNTFIAIDEFTLENGGTHVVPGSHGHVTKPSDEYISSNHVQLTCQPGSVICFDSTLWHAGGSNTSSSPRRAINMQWTKPFIKQQLDYPRMLAGHGVDTESVLAQKLGMWSVPPPSVNSYRVADPKLRTYRAGQG